jgi:hypothetical protein
MYNLTFKINIHKLTHCYINLLSQILKKRKSEYFHNFILSLGKLK